MGPRVRLSCGALTVALFFLLQVIRMTGFMKGLYTDAEMKSDNVKVGGLPRVGSRGFISRARGVPFPCWLWLDCEVD